MSIDTPAPKARFGSIAGLVSGTDDDLEALVRQRQQASRSVPATESQSARAATLSPKAEPRSKKQQGVASSTGAEFIYVGVADDVRHAAPELAKVAQRTIGDLVILGTQLDLTYGVMVEAAPSDLPLGKQRAAEPNLGTMQVRITRAQREWLDAHAAAANAVSMRQYAGAALTAYVVAHRHELPRT